MGNVEPMRTSSSRREIGSESHPKTIGCMSGIFHFISSTHHSRTRKRLTSGKRKEIKCTTPTPTKTRAPPSLSPEVDVAKKTETRRLSRETPRSPTVQQQIRRKRPPDAVAAASVDSPRRSPVLLARLMGLEESPAPTAAAAAPADKRRELLRALEKCDEDLKALRRIIEAVRTAENNPNSEPVSSARTAGRLLGTDGGRDSKSECNNGEQPSPVSVLDAVSSSPRFRSRSFPQDEQETAAGSRIVKPSRTALLFTVDNCKKMEAIMPRATGERSWWRRKSGVSRAMAETVEEVWEEGAWEEKWETGRVAMWVETGILWDLLEELAVELLRWYRKLSPPLRTCCRKKLRF